MKVQGVKKYRGLEERKGNPEVEIEGDVNRNKENMDYK